MRHDVHGTPYITNVCELMHILARIVFAAVNTEAAKRRQNTFCLGGGTTFKIRACYYAVNVCTGSYCTVSGQVGECTDVSFLPTHSLSNYTTSLNKLQISSTRQHDQFADAIIHVRITTVDLVL
jgi:hypothetical protein